MIGNRMPMKHNGGPAIIRRVMSILTTVDVARRLVTMRYEGASPTAQEWAASLLEVFKAPGYEPGFAFLVDRRGVPSPTADWVRFTVSFRERHAAQIAGSRWAVVVSDPANFGMGRMGEILLEIQGVTQATFKSMEEAELWLLRGIRPK
jgi:hypothetical protein